MSLLQRSDRRGKIAAAFGLNLAVMLVCGLFLTPQLINNDDSVIYMIISGAYGQYSAALAHTNWLLGSLLSLLARLAPSLNWLTVLEYLFLFLSGSLLTSCLFLRSRGWFGGALGLFFTLSVMPFFYTELHNTKCVPLFAVCGLLAVFTALDERLPLLGLLGALTAVFASFFRLQAFLIGAAFAFFVGLVTVCDFSGLSGPRDWFKKYRKYICGFALLFAAVFLLTCADTRWAESDGGALEYRQYNAARGSVSDFELPDYAQNAEAYKALGISQNDLLLLEDWSFADGEKFDTDTLTSIAALREDASPGAALGRFSESLKAELLPDRYFLLALGTALLALALCRGRWRLAALLMLGGYFGIYLYFCYIGRTTRWVTAGMTAALIAGLLYCFKEPKLNKVPLRAISAAIICFSVAFSGFSYAGQVGSYRESFSESLQEIYHELGAGGELYLMDLGTAPALQRIFPSFSGIDFGMFDNIYFLGGWDTGSPAKNSVLERHGVTGSPYRAWAERDDIFLVDTQSYESKIAFLRENYFSEAGVSLYDTVHGYYIFAAALPQSPGSQNAFPITDSDCTADGVIPSFLYIGAAFEYELGDGDTVYFELSEADGSGYTYMARPLGDGAVCSVPWSDLDPFGHYSLRVIVSGSDSSSASSPAELTLN